MKHYIVLFCLSAVLFCCGCDNGNDPVNNGEDPFKTDVEGDITLPQGNDAFPYIVLTKSEQGVSTGANAFGIDMFKDVVKDSGPKKNAVFSPFSLSLALSLTASGAQGNTLSEMAEVLGFKGYTSEEIGSYYNKLVTALATADKGTVISSANAVWTAADLKKDYVNEVTKYYDARIEKMDFAKDPAGCTRKINDWTREKTNGLIEKIFDGTLQPDIRTVLTNALYFNGKWSSGPMETRKRDFNGIDGTVKQCDFFYNTQSLNSYFGQDASVIKIPYGNAAFSMVFVLPEENTDFTDFVSYITAERWEKWLSHLSTNEVFFNIPAFKDQGDFKQLRDILEKRGMKKAFTGSADFSKMSNETLYISDVLQKATIDVNNTGTEAAAVTAIMMKDSSIGVGGEMEIKPFIADRPFLYAIVENSHNTLLFIGQHVTVSK